MSTAAGISVREARADDAEQVAELLNELGYPGNEGDEVRQRLTAWAQESAGVVLVADRGDLMAGALALMTIPYLEHGGRWGRIVALVVSASCRGQGIGSRLVEAAEKVAAGRGCIVMEVTSARGRVESHPFYRSLGYQEWCDRSALYLKELVPGASAGSYGARFPAAR